MSHDIRGKSSSTSPSSSVIRSIHPSALSLVSHLGSSSPLRPSSSLGFQPSSQYVHNAKPITSSTEASFRTLRSMARPRGSTACGKYTCTSADALSPRPLMAAYISPNGFEVVPEDLSIADKADVLGAPMRGSVLRVKTISWEGACWDIRGGADVLRGRVSRVCDGE